jgi:hypothetical protein
VLVNVGLSLPWHTVYQTYKRLGGLMRRLVDTDFNRSGFRKSVREAMPIKSKSGQHRCHGISSFDIIHETVKLIEYPASKSTRFRMRLIHTTTKASRNDGIYADKIIVFIRAARAATTFDDKLALAKSAMREWHNCLDNLRLGIGFVNSGIGAKGDLETSVEIDPQGKVSKARLTSPAKSMATLFRQLNRGSVKKERLPLMRLPNGHVALRTSDHRSPVALNKFTPESQRHLKEYTTDSLAMKLF